MYNKGHGGPRDQAEARRLLELAVAKGRADAQYYLGGMHLSGEGGPHDVVEGRRLLELAAVQGHAQARTAIAVLGHVVGQDIIDDRKAKVAAQPEEAFATAETGPSNVDHITRQLATTIENGDPHMDDDPRYTFSILHKVQYQARGSAGQMIHQQRSGLACEMNLCPVQGPLHLSMANYCKVDRLKGDNKFVAPDGSHVEADMWRIIEKLPDTLLISLARHTGKVGGRMEVNTLPVEYPPLIDFSAPEYKDLLHTPSNAQYRLVAVHAGRRRRPTEDYIIWWGYILAPDHKWWKVRDYRHCTQYRDMGMEVPETEVMSHVRGGDEGGTFAVHLWYREVKADHATPLPDLQMSPEQKALGKDEFKATGYIARREDNTKRTTACQEGNAAFKAGNYEKAIEYFTKSIELGGDHVLYSNRSACHCKLHNFAEALKDAEACIAVKPDWGKGYGRKGAALHGLLRFPEAGKAYADGLEIEPALAMLTNGLADAQREGIAAARDLTAGGLGGLGNVFSAPDVLQKIASNPQTAPLLADPSFMAKLEELKRDPSSIDRHLSDPRILKVLTALTGVPIVSGPGSPGRGRPVMAEFHCSTEVAAAAASGAEPARREGQEEVARRVAATKARHDVAKEAQQQKLDEEQASNFSRSVQLLEKQAEKMKSADTQFRLGQKFLVGEDCPKDFVEARRYLGLAAAQGPCSRAVVPCWHATIPSWHA